MRAALGNAAFIAAICVWMNACSGLVVPLPAAQPAVSLKGISLPRVSDGKEIDLGNALSSSPGKTMLVLGTHPGDFNMVEYAQKVRYFWPRLQEKGVKRCIMVMNGQASSCSQRSSTFRNVEELSSTFRRKSSFFQIQRARQDVSLVSAVDSVRRRRAQP